MYIQCIYPTRDPVPSSQVYTVSIKKANTKSSLMITSTNNIEERKNVIIVMMTQNNENSIWRQN